MVWQMKWPYDIYLFLRRKVSVFQAMDSEPKDVFESRESVANIVENNTWYAKLASAESPRFKYPSKSMVCGLGTTTRI